MTYRVRIILALTGLAISCPACGKKSPDPVQPDNSTSDKGPTTGPATTTDKPKMHEVKVLKAQTTLATRLENGLFSLALTSDGKYLAGQGTGKEKSIQIWDLEKKELRWAFENEAAPVSPTAFSPDNKVAAFATLFFPNGMFLVDVDSGKKLPPLKARLGSFTAGLAYSPDGSLLLYVANKQVIGWNPKTDEQRFAWVGDQEVTALSNFFDEGKKIASGQRGEREQVKIWDVAAGKPIQTMASPDLKGNRIKYMAVASDGKKLATRHTLGPVRIWDITNGKILKEGNESILLSNWTNVLFMPDNKTVVFGGSSREDAFGGGGEKDHRGNVYLVDSDTGNATHRLEGHTKEITALAVTPDGATLASASADKTVKIWKLK
jgi:WD40 repeat protein